MLILHRTVGLLTRGDSNFHSIPALMGLMVAPPQGALGTSRVLQESSSAFFIIFNDFFTLFPQGFFFWQNPIKSLVAGFEVECIETAILATTPFFLCCVLIHLVSQMCRLTWRLIAGVCVRACQSPPAVCGWAPSDGPPVIGSESEKSTSLPALRRS